MSETKIKTIDIPDGLLSAENIKYTEDQTVKDVLDLAEIQTTTEQTLPNSKPGGLKLVHMDGNSEQKTYSGKNKLDCSGLTTQTISGVTFTPVYKANGELDYINTNGTATKQVSINLTNGALLSASEFEGYKVSGTPSGSSSQSHCIVCGYYDENKKWKSESYNSINELTISSTYPYFDVGILVQSGVTLNNVKFYPMISAEGGEYEPFTNGASPNPSYPQSIKNTGDSVEMMSGCYNSDTGAASSDNRYVRSGKLPCSPNDVIKVSCDYADGFKVFFFNEDTYLSFSELMNVTSHEATAPSNATHFTFGVRNSNGLTPQTVGKITLTINDKYVVPVKTVGKNSFDGTERNGQWAGAVENLFWDSVTIRLSTGLIRLTSKTVTFSLNSAITNLSFINVRGFDKDGNILSLGARDLLGDTLSVTCREFTVTYPDEAEYCAVTCRGYNDGSNVISAYSLADEMLQIEFSDTKTDYEPYTEHTEYILLDEPLRKVGDVADQIVEVDDVWGVERPCEEDALTTVNTCTAIEGGYRINVPLTHKVTSSLIHRLALCTSAIFNNDWLAINKFCFSGSYASVNIQVPTDILENGTVEEAQEWLIANDVRVLYPLATPTFTPLDTESQKALNRLKTFNSVTYVEVDSKIQPSGMEFEYGTSQVGAYTLEALLNSKRALIVDPVETETAEE